jgi:hypothetical protein
LSTSRRGRAMSRPHACVKPTHKTSRGMPG